MRAWDRLSPSEYPLLSTASLSAQLYIEHGEHSIRDVVRLVGDPVREVACSHPSSALEEREVALQEPREGALPQPPRRPQRRLLSSGLQQEGHESGNSEARILSSMSPSRVEDSAQVGPEPPPASVLPSRPLAPPAHLGMDG